METRNGGTDYQDKNAAVSVGDTTTALIAAASAITESRAVMIHNQDIAKTIYLAVGEDATTAKFPLGPGQRVTLKTRLAINGIVSSGTASAFVFSLSERQS